MIESTSEVTRALIERSRQETRALLERMDRSSEEMRALLVRIQKGLEEARREMASAIKYIAELIVAASNSTPRARYLIYQQGGAQPETVIVSQLLRMLVSVYRRLLSLSLVRQRSILKS